MRLGDDELVRRSGELAATLLRRSGQLTTASQRRRQRRVRRLMTDRAGAALVFRLADRVLRAVDARAAGSQLEKLARGPLPGLSEIDAVALRLAGIACYVAPGPVTALVGARLRYETRELVLGAPGQLLAWETSHMRRNGQRPNLNLLGEAVLGEEEASARAGAVAELLSRPGADCVSVKVPSVSAGLSLVDFEGSVERVASALAPLYREAARSSPPKLVNLDMEELRDLPITVEAFRRAMSRPGLENVTGGIALQAYSPRPTMH